MPDKPSFLTQVRNDPATKGLLENLGGYVGAQAGRLAGRATGSGSKSDSGSDSNSEASSSGGLSGAAVGAASGVVENKMSGDGGSSKWAAIKGAVKGFFGKGGGNKRPTNIYEQLLIGVPVEVAYREWKNYAEFPKFMKGPESVSDQDEEGKTKWTAKIFVNRRSWTAQVEEDIENYKIRWSTEAPKGTIDGTVTFNPLGDNLTAMVYVLEYRPKGFFEWWGNRNRVVGRRARLDVKHFGRYVTMQPADEEEEEAEEDQDQDQDQIQESPESDKQVESAEQPVEESQPDQKEPVEESKPDPKEGA